MVRKHEWYKPGAINVKEAEAAAKGLSYAQATAQSVHRGINWFTDSQAVLGAACKGRSPSHGLNDWINEILNSEMKGGNVPVFGHWIPSNENLADKPSREIDMCPPNSSPPSTTPSEDSRLWWDAAWRAAAQTPKKDDET